jgi:hypothetical protein
VTKVDGKTIGETITQFATVREIDLEDDYGYVPGMSRMERTFRNIESVCRLDHGTVRRLYY